MRGTISGVDNEEITGNNKY